MKKASKDVARGRKRQQSPWEIRRKESERGGTKVFSFFAIIKKKN